MEGFVTNRDFALKPPVLTAVACTYLSWVNSAFQWRLLLAQLGVGVAQPGQGGAVRVEVRLLIWRVEEPTLQQQQEEVSEALRERRSQWCWPGDDGSPFCRG